MPKLTEAEFQATFSPPMQRAGQNDAPPFDFWPYVDSIPVADYEGYDCSGSVTYVYRDASGRYEHVLLDSDDRDTFMVVALDREARRVVGHRLVDLGVMYGLREADEEYPEIVSRTAGTPRRRELLALMQRRT